MRLPAVRFFCNKPSAGFSLIEVLFALAVVGLVLGATASLIGNFRLGHAAASDLDAALALARNELAEAGADAPLAPGVRDGRDGRFAWRLAVARFTDGDNAPPPGLGLYRIEAQIAWRDGAALRRIALSTLRLAPAPPP
jgi:general secretion pathway protein I